MVSSRRPQSTDVESQQPPPVERSSITTSMNIYHLTKERPPGLGAVSCVPHPLNNCVRRSQASSWSPCASTASVLHPTSFRTCDQRPRRHLSTPRLVLESGHTHDGQFPALRSRGRSRVTSNRSLRPMEGAPIAPGIFDSRSQAHFLHDFNILGILIQELAS